MDSTSGLNPQTLPYFLKHGTRGGELCFVMLYPDCELEYIAYVDSSEHFLNTIPSNLWDTKVYKHFYEALTISQSYGSGEVKGIGNIQVHYIYVRSL